VKTLIVALVLGLSAIASASAADLPAAKGPPPAPTVAPYNWTGFYAGVDAGYGWGGSTGDVGCINPSGVVSGFGCSFPESNLLSPGGGLLGGLAGYNFQTGALVFGVETDLQWSGIDDKVSEPLPCCVGLATPPGTVAASANLDWFGTVRARVGVAAIDRTLIYATGGLIYGEERASNNFFSGPIAYPASASSTRAGWTLGGGAEYAFTANVTARVEALYYDLGSQTLKFTCTTGVTCSPGFSVTNTFDDTGGIVRAALAYKF
jgi:outer membrane immunogenic protein